MIRIENINIIYDRIIVEDGEVRIPSGKMVAISGESGSGKTTLLYLLGLISSNKDYRYFYKNTEVNLMDDRLISAFRRRKIGFLMQDNSLIENLTIEENMRLSASLAGYEISGEEIEEQLSFVGLKIEKKNYPKQLSGGELQRAALACIMAKKPEIILADEPTSALDKANEKMIIQTFKRLSDRGVTIVVATHNPSICDEADIVYTIKNGRIHCEDNLDHVMGPDTIGSMPALPFSFGVLRLFRYARETTKKTRILMMTMIVFCAIAISGFCVASELSKGMNETQSMLLNQISDREIFLVHMTTSQALVRDSDENLSIKKEDYEQIKNITTIQEIYPYFEFRSFSLNPQYRRLGTEISVLSDKGEEVVPFSLESNPQRYFIIMPYNANQKLGEQLSKQYAHVDSGIYLSHELASKLGLLEIESTEVHLEFEVGIPVKTYVDEFIDENDNKIKTDLDLMEFKQMNIEVAGILNPEVLNSYSINGNHVIYMPHETMNRILEEQIKASDEAYEFSDFELKEWSPSSYLIYSNTYNDMENIQQKLQNINSNFIAKSDYQDTLKMDEMLEGVRKVSSWIMLTFLGILFVLMSAIFIHHTLGRSREIALLKTNGMTNKKLVELMIVEGVYHGIKIASISLGMSVLLSLFVNHYLFGYPMIKFTFNIPIYTIFISLLYVLIPGITSILFTLRIKPDRILRN